MCDLASAYCVPRSNPMGGVGGAAMGGASGIGGALGGQGGVQAGGAGGTPGLGGAAGSVSAGGAGATAGMGGVAGNGMGGVSGDGGLGGTGGTQEPTPEMINMPGSCQSTWGQQDNGSITFYTFNQGTGEDVHCSFGIESRDPDRVRHVYTGNGEHFGAMNTEDYNNSGICGACVEVRRDDGRNVKITIVDECPIGTNNKCVKGHIDLSRSAFLQVAQEQEGYVGQRAGLGSINWNYIPCETQGNVSVRFVEPDNEYYDGIVVENHPYPIQSVEVWDAGNWVQCSRVAYNFWFPPGEDIQGDPPYYFKITDMNGGVFTTMALPEAPGSHDTGQTQSCQ